MTYHIEEPLKESDCTIRIREMSASPVPSHLEEQLLPYGLPEGATLGEATVFMYQMEREQTEGVLMGLASQAPESLVASAHTLAGQAIDDLESAGFYGSAPALLMLGNLASFGHDLH